MPRSSGIDDDNIMNIFVALSYRGFWKSGIEQDDIATLDYVSREHDHNNEDVTVILWGQSIGASIAVVHHL
ncbi:MAG: hypothetical protein MMC33_010418 [Icmadophila ericetorum]|nr:hypothetical protein [Icmadophila ericetorum]